jgi:hypothetical protein
VLLVTKLDQMVYLIWSLLEAVAAQAVAQVVTAQAVVVLVVLERDE